MNTTFRLDPEDVPLFVDLDGTLVQTDTLLESVIALIRSNIFYIFLLPIWLTRGKAYLKEQVASRIKLNPESLPYHETLLRYLKKQREDGRQLVLATASNLRTARTIAEHLGIFDEVLASDNHTNLSGAKKLCRIQSLIGDGKFDYVGNAHIDLTIWRHARRAILVNPHAGVETAVRKLADIEQVFLNAPKQLRQYLKVLRIHQWIKNTLVFVPVFAAHQVMDSRLILDAGLGFLAFGLCASSVYLVNDMFDLEADRFHPTKSKRLFAAGTLPLSHGILLAPVLLLCAFSVAWMLPRAFLLMLGLYYVTTLAYSLRLKQFALIDVLTLAGLYTLRILAGGAATQVDISFWLLAFSTFIFLSLGLLKRYSELLTLIQQGQVEMLGRGYSAVDMETLANLGGSSGFISVFVLALYINSEKVSQLYTHPKLIWLLCPLLLYWVGRVWLTARRGEMGDDPVVFATKDPGSRVVILLGILILTLAT